MPISKTIKFLLLLTALAVAAVVAAPITVAAGAGADGGFLYTFVPEGATLTVTMTLDCGQAVIYDYAPRISGETDGTRHTFVFGEVTPHARHKIFVIGEAAADVYSDAPFVCEPLSCREYAAAYGADYDAVTGGGKTDVYCEEMEKMVKSGEVISAPDFFVGRIMRQDDESDDMKLIAGITISAVCGAVALAAVITGIIAARKGAGQ